MKEIQPSKRKARGAATASSRRNKGAATTKGNCKQQQLHSKFFKGGAALPADVVFMASEPATSNLRAVMNAHGAGLLGALGQQMDAHLNSLAVLEGASRALTIQCSSMALEIGKLLEALEQFQGAHADALVQATVLRGLVADFAQHTHNAQALGITN